MYASFPTQYVTKLHGHAFGLRVKAMLLAQCKLFYVKEFLITNYCKAFCNAIYTGKIVTFLGVYFNRLCFLTGQKLSWPVTLTGEPPGVISRPEIRQKFGLVHIYGKYTSITSQS
jgi:hypothetical protein